MITNPKTEENIFNPTEPIYCIVPGFLGNYNQGFLKALRDLLIKHKKNVCSIKFYGHETIEKKLWNTYEMSSHLKSELSRIRKENPKNTIIILAHSQGSAITAMSHKEFDKNTEIIFLAPAIFISEIILPRISDIDKKNITQSTQPVLCKVSKNNKKLLDQLWVESYETCNPQKYLNQIQQNCTVIQAMDDFIDSKNIICLIENIPKISLAQIKTNHWFDEPSVAFEELAQKILK